MKMKETFVGPTIRRTCLLALAAILPLAACDESTSPDDDGRLELAFTGLEPLANGYHYEGWAITDGTPVSTGKFNVDTNGVLVTVAGATITDGAFDTDVDLEDADEIVITIEPSGDTDAVPSSTKILAGSLTGTSATLSIDASQALGTNFSTAEGTFILATPTDGDTTANETSGIWFLEMVGGMPMAGLVLPTLPAGWRYEGWAVIDGQPVTTGTFTTPIGADAAAPFSGPQPGPPFPGEDFLMNAPAGLSFPTNLSGAMAVITVEPMPDDSPMPFTLKPLTRAIPAGAADRTPYAMSLSTTSFPSGTATVDD